MNKFLTSIILYACCSVAYADERPNIVVVLTDDQGYADVGFHGSKDIKTPNLDTLASNGVILSKAFVAHPFCGPSRAALMTGRYPHKIGAQFNLPTKGSFLGVPTTEKFISKRLQEAGYFTGAMGKWHLGEADPFHPNKRGFDEFYGFLGGGHKYFPEEFTPKYNRLKERGTKNIDLYLHPLQHNGVEVDEKEYVTDALSREAVSFIDKASNKTQPFFLYVAYNAPHVPLEALPEDLALFSQIKDIKRRKYAAMVWSVDRGIGLIVDKLKEKGEFDNTLFVFLSDNGGKTTLGANNSPLRNGKGSAYEGGFRVPMMFHWPNKIKAGSRYDYPVSALDFYPSFVALADHKAVSEPRLDGLNIIDSIITNTNARENTPIYALRHRKGFSDAAIHQDQWKAVNVGKKGWELYNIDADLSETQDVSDQHPLILNDMVTEMEKWSWDNKQPLWFHRSSEGVDWRKEAMPRPDITFENK